MELVYDLFDLFFTVIGEKGINRYLISIIIKLIINLIVILLFLFSL